MKRIGNLGTMLAVSVLLLAPLAGAQENSGSSCPKGTSQRGPQCIPCPRNKYSDEEGASKCKDCPVGFKTSSAGSTSPQDCEPCDPGKFFKNGTCNNCPIDTFSSEAEAATGCTPCPPGTVSPQKSSSPNDCKKCPEGLVTVRGRFIRCELCPQGKTTTSETSFVCEDCPPGTFQSENRRLLGGGKCQPCRPGSFADKKGTARCKPCPKGFFQTGMGATRCNKCPEGSTTAGERGRSCRPTCLPSEPGCISCPPGEGYNADKKKCERCRNGFISPTASSTECFACPEGEGKSNDLRTKCVCKPGYRLKRDGMCVKCPQRYTSTDGSACICALTGKKTGPCVCPEGQQFDFNEDKCLNPLACPDGSVLDFGECRKCPGESFPDDAKTTCTCGGKGKGLMRGKCDLCPPGKAPTTIVSSERATIIACSKCSAPQFNDKKGAERCMDCPEGQGPSRDGATSCLAPCPPGADREGDKCRCKPGFASSGRGLDLNCTECMPNEVVFKNNCVCPSEVFVGSGNAQCQECPKKTYVSNGKCVCEDGFTKNMATGDCAPCPKGTFSDFSTMQKCEPCPPGEVSTKNGQSFCDTCNKGLVPFRGIKCLPQCAKGYFRNKDEMCVQCATGQRVVNLTCQDCPGNAVSDGGDTTKCTRCQEGKAPNDAGDKCVTA